MPTNQDSPPHIVIVGQGRAGSAFARALSGCGWTVEVVSGRSMPDTTGGDADILLLCVPDEAIGSVAEQLRSTDAAVLHVSGATTLEPLRRHARHGSVHPLLALSSPEHGAEQLRSGATFAVAGDEATKRIVDALGGTAVHVPDEQRAVYHAAAAVAANHLVALSAQVETLARESGVPVDAFFDLAQDAFDAARTNGAAAALTGPVSRADWDTVRRHLDALPHSERPAYRALARRAAALAGHPWPADLE